MDILCKENPKVNRPRTVTFGPDGITETEVPDEKVLQRTSRVTLHMSSSPEQKFTRGCE